jgi:hypothetical protein
VIRTAREGGGGSGFDLRAREASGEAPPPCCSRFVRAAQAESLSPIKAFAFRFRLAEAKGVGILESGSADHVDRGLEGGGDAWRQEAAVGFGAFAIMGLLTSTNRHRLHLIDRDAAGNGLAIFMGFRVVKKAQGRFFFRVKRPDPQIQ